MLSNAYFLAKFRFDTAENEPAKNLQNFAKKIANFADPNPLTLTALLRLHGVHAHEAAMPGRKLNKPPFLSHYITLGMRIAKSLSRNFPLLFIVSLSPQNSDFPEK